MTIIIILIKKISRAPIYCTKWEHRALYNNTPTNTPTHTHTQRPSTRQGGSTGHFTITLTTHTHTHMHTAWLWKMLPWQPSAHRPFSSNSALSRFCHCLPQPVGSLCHFLHSAAASELPLILHLIKKLRVSVLDRGRALAFCCCCWFVCPVNRDVISRRAVSDMVAKVTSHVCK